MSINTGRPAIPMNNIPKVVFEFIDWLESYGETSQDHQDFYASRIGRRAKRLYYDNRVLGKIAVLPMVFCEAFLPRSRSLFYPRTRLPIADAHYAMGFALLFMLTQRQEFYDKAVHFLDILIESRCSGYNGWGYPFHWQTRGGVIKAGTPLITTTPYCYEAFEYVHRIDGRQEWLDMMYLISEHVLKDYRDEPYSKQASTCTYTPSGGAGVVNASAYRAAMLMKAWKRFDKNTYRETATRNLNFVLETQREDGSWPYAVDGIRDFIDHFHTCFVLKGLAKVQNTTGSNGRIELAIKKGIHFYLTHLFDNNGLPIPFAKAPRLIVYRRELYDYAECLNLVLLLKGRFQKLYKVGECVLKDLLLRWRKRDGSFKSRELLLGWDNVPMHRWGQSMIFRSLCLKLYSEAGGEIC